MVPTPAERFAVVLELYEFAKQQMRANLRRRHPSSSEVELEAKLAEWARDRRCAPDGDAAGTRRPLELHVDHD